MRKFLLFAFIIFFVHLCHGQGNMITISSTVPAQMTICGGQKLFTITIYNPSPFTLLNDTLKLTMPPGIEYLPGTITGATENNISTANEPVFLLQNIPTLTTVNISYYATVRCAVMAYTSGGGVIENQVRVNYTANNVKNFDAHTTSSYIIRQPNLSIVSITNQSYTGNIGDVFTRCISITNGGLGELSEFTLTENHGHGLQITAVDKGAWTNSGNDETIVLNGNEFTTIGDNDTLFENGETIVLCETVNILNCISVAAAYEAYWGCNGQACQSSLSTANVVFPNLIPNLIVTPNSGNIYAPMNSCPTQASQQELKIENTGLGQATDVHMDIFQSTGAGYQAYLGSRIDENSFTIQIGGGAPVPLAVDTSEVTATLSCMSPTDKGRVKFTIPSINAGETVYIRWNTYTCCYNACTGVGQNYFNGWRYSGNYSNICQSPYVITETWGRVYSQMYGTLDNNSSLSTLSSGQTGTFNFIFSSFGQHYSYPVSPSAYWKFEFTLPACLEYSGNLKITSYNGVDVWTPTSVTPSGSTLTAIFNGAAPFWLDHAEVTIDLTVNCSGCSGSSGALGVKAIYVPDAGCGCEINLTCQSAAISVLCPSPCPEGMAFSYFDMVRTSYGKPDNEPGGGNGIPDGSGSLDFTKIKTGRAMFGDTITSNYTGRVITSINHPSWQYCYAYSSISNGNLLSFLDARLLIYRGGSLFATCTSFTPTVVTSGTTSDFKYDLSAPALIASGYVPAGFLYANNDSVVFKPRYKVTVNTGGPILSCYSSNEYYMSDIASPTLPSDKYQCANYNGTCSVLGYYLTTSGGDNFAVKSCDNVTIYQNYYCSIGPCCSNYQGGNLFPYEYRNWAHMDTLTAVVPAGYDFVSANFIEYRTAGTLNYVVSSAIPLNPVNPNSNILKFSTEEYYQGYGGTLPLSDDGFVGTLSIVLTPSCEVTPTVVQDIRYDWTFTPTSFITGSGSYPTFISYVQDYITYEAPDLFLQSSLPSVQTPGIGTSWDISISNTSNASSSINTWLGIPSISGITVTQVYDLDNNIAINNSGNDIYQVGTVNAGAVRNFRLTATYTSCSQDSIIVYSGWNCTAGYPSTVAAYPCTPEQITLKSTPLIPLLVVNVTGPASTVDLCDTASYTIEGLNVQLGTAYNLTLTATLPIGVNIIPGTSQLSYPTSGPYTGISDPVFMGGTKWQWNISTANAQIGTDGLKGILQPTLNDFNLTFKVSTNCGYTSGSVIGFNLVGQSACGLPTGQDVALSSQLGITGATPPYNANIRLSTTYISPCAGNSTMRVAVQDNGPSAFGNVDSVVVQLPPGVTFIPGSFAQVHNAPPTPTPVSYSLNGSMYLIWPLPTGTALGDSSVFTFDYAGDPELLSCDISEFSSQTISATDVTCTLTGNNCPINIITGDTTLAVYTYKAYLDLSNASATSILNPPGGETISIALDIINTGQAITSGANSVIQFYYDANGNSVYDPADVYIDQNSFAVTNNDTIPYTHTFNVPAGQACAIIAIVDTAVNPCVCNPSQILVMPQLHTSFPDSTLCSGQTMTLGASPVTGYGYNWSTALNISDSTIANPLFTANNTSGSPVSTNYIVTTDRMGCSVKDTLTITVNPRPASDAGTNILTCSSDTLGSIGTTATLGYTYHWSPSAGLNDTLSSSPTVSLSDTGSFAYIVTTTALGCSTKDTVNVRVNPVPLANISGTTTVCVGSPMPAITFTASNGTYPIIADYTINNGPTQTVTISNSGSTTITAQTGTAGTFVYNLISVQESSSTGCSQLLNDSVTIIVNPLPTATITGTIQVCKNAAPPMITFTGASGSPPYTFTYKIDSGSPQTITTLSGNSIAIPASTTVSDTFNYILISVLDSSATACSQLQPDTATVIVHPLPVAAFGLEEVCFNETVQFSDSSTVFNTSINSWQWDFGDNTTVNTTQNPSHTYASAGTFTVSLITTTTQGCKDTTSQQATVHPLPDAGFTTTPALNTVCGATTFQLTDTSVIASPDVVQSWTWNYGDGSAPAFSQNTSHLFDTGTYTIELKVLSDFGCADSTSRTITIYPQPIANFGLEEVCLNQSILFSDSSVIAGSAFSSWEWNFGDSSAVNTTQSPVYVYANPGTYNIKLVVTTTDGCMDSTAKSTTVHPLPVAQFSTSPALDGICDQTPLQFTDASTIAVPDIIQAWIWDLDNGSAAVLSQNTSYLYGSPGSYSVELKVVSGFGCTDSVTKTVTINPKPTVNFSGSPVAGCEPLCIAFIDSSLVSSGNNVQWVWSAANGTITGNSQNFEYCFNNDAPVLPALYDITLTVTTDSGCVTTLTKPNYITVYPLPEAGFTTDPEMTTVMNPVFSVVDLSIGADSWSWDFGDGDTANGPPPLSHTYAADTATYLMRLITTTQYGCRDTAYKSVVIGADFSFFIPNAFTPNDDGVNDFFFGKGIGIAEYELFIFDRWGNRVFYGNNIPVEDASWNGKVDNGKEIAQMDVYVWKVLLTDIYGKKHKFRGTVTLVR